jgi:MFS family permease
MSFLAIMVASFLSALDQTALGTALPTIATALNDTNGDYIWVFIVSLHAQAVYPALCLQVGAAYAMASTAFIPLSGSLANAFGRHASSSFCPFPSYRRPLVKETNYAFMHFILCGR